MDNSDTGLELSPLLADEENQASKDNLPDAARVNQPVVNAVAEATRQRNILESKQQNRVLWLERCYHGMVGTLFVGVLIVLIDASNKEWKAKEEKLREHEQNIYCFDLELINFTEQPLDFLRPRGGSYCSISPWKNIAPNATTHITRKGHLRAGFYSRMICQFSISTDIALTAAVDGYDDDEYKHDTITSQGKDENNCEIKIHKLSDCSWGLFKKCPKPINDLALEYQTLSKS